MTAVEAAPETERGSAPIIKYSPDKAAIAKLRGELAEQIPDPEAAVRTPAGYELVRKAIATLRSGRTAIEKARVEQKAESLAWGRKVDAHAHELTALIVEIEAPLKAAKEKVDNEKEMARVAAAEQAARDAEEARMKVIRDEEAKLAAERERLAADAAKLQAERDRLAELARVAEVAQRAAQEKLDADRQAVEAERKAMDERKRAERERLDRIEFERVVKEKAAVEAKAKAEAEARAKAEEERLARLKAEADAAEARRIEEGRPDAEKVRAYGAAINLLRPPVVSTAEARGFLDQVRSELIVLGNRCQAFGGRNTKTAK